MINTIIIEPVSDLDTWEVVVFIGEKWTEEGELGSITCHSQRMANLVAKDPLAAERMRHEQIRINMEIRKQADEAIASLIGCNRGRQVGPNRRGSI